MGVWKSIAIGAAGAFVGAGFVGAGVWFAMDQKYLMTIDSTRDWFHAERAETYHQYWSGIRPLWDGACNIGFNENGVAEISMPDQELGVDPVGVPISPEQVVGSAAYFGDRHAIRCLMTLNWLTSGAESTYGISLYANYFGAGLPEEFIAQAESNLSRGEAYSARLLRRDVFDAAARSYAREMSKTATEQSPAAGSGPTNGDAFIEAVRAEVARLERLRAERE